MRRVSVNLRTGSKTSFLLKMGVLSSHQQRFPTKEVPQAIQWQASEAKRECDVAPHAFTKVKDLLNWSSRGRRHGLSLATICLLCYDVPGALPYTALPSV